MQPRLQVEQLPRLDASELVWTGLLDRAWREGGGDSEPWPYEQLVEDFEAAYADRRVATLLRVVASTPCPVGPDSVALELELEVRESWFLPSDVRRVQQRLHLVATAPPFGGARWWFRCGGCGARRSSMYPGSIGYHWACRTCWGLTYRSRAQYGYPWGRGRGCGSALRYAWDRLDAEDRQRERASYRRRMSRSRARWRGHPASASKWPVALTCRPCARSAGAR